MTSKTGIVAAASGCAAAALVTTLLAAWSGGDPVAGLSPVRDSALGGRPWPALASTPPHPWIARSGRLGSPPD